jgi:hypothetical protein
MVVTFFPRQRRARTPDLGNTYLFIPIHDRAAKRLAGEDVFARIYLEQDRWGNQKGSRRMRIRLSGFAFDAAMAERTARLNSVRL